MLYDYMICYILPHVGAVLKWLDILDVLSVLGRMPILSFFLSLGWRVAGNRVRAYMKYFHGQFEKSL